MRNSQEPVQNPYVWSFEDFLYFHAPQQNDLGHLQIFPLTNYGIVVYRNVIENERWSGREDSNLRPYGPELSNVLFPTIATECYHSTTSCY